MIDPSQPLLAMHDVCVSKDGTTIWTHLDMTWQRGEHWAIVGPSGSGKSLFLQLIMGRVNISHGHLHPFFADRYLQQHQEDGTYRTFRDLVAYVSPQHHFKNRNNTQTFYYQQRFNSSDADEAVTVAEYLENIHAVQADAQWTVARVTSLLNLHELTGKSLIKLSNGETRRLMLAAALMKNPALLLLDMPLVGLDSETRQRFGDILNSVMASGIHVMMATSPDEIPGMLTHVAVLQPGKPVALMPRLSFNKDHYFFGEQAAETTDSAAIIHSLIDSNQPPVFQSIIQLNNVTIRYGDKVILDKVSWLVKQGEHWVLRGHNGAGKSTLLSLVNGDNPQAYSNDILLFDRQRGTGESIWQIKKHIGFVSPELHQYFPSGQTSLQAVLSGLFDTVGLFRKPTIQQQEIALRWLTAFNISHLAGKRLSQLSLSNQRLCLLARALIKNPVLLILDEPCQGLDHMQRDHFKEVINQICLTGKVTLIYVSHYQEDIPSSVNKSLTLENGKVI